MASSFQVGEGNSRSQLGVHLVPPHSKLVLRGILSVSDNNNFVAEQSPGSGYVYRAYGELSHFVYCILQKIKKSESLPLVEKWEDYMLPSHSSFAAIDEEHFLVGTRIHAALAKMSSSYLRKEFRNNARRFLDEFCTTILSTVAARSKLGQGVSCFCPEIILGGDDHSAFFLHGQLLDGLVECGWEKGSHVEACKAEFQSFVQEQRQLERHSTRNRPDQGEHPGLLRSPVWISESLAPVPSKLSHQFQSRLHCKH